jgi:hypothetical protein
LFEGLSRLRRVTTQQRSVEDDVNASVALWNVYSI